MEESFSQRMERELAEAQQREVVRRIESATESTVSRLECCTMWLRSFALVQATQWAVLARESAQQSTDEAREVVEFVFWCLGQLEDAAQAVLSDRR